MLTIDLSNKIALITGASRGIGLAIAQAYASAGAKVVLSSRKQEALDAAAQVKAESDVPTVRDENRAGQTYPPAGQRWMTPLSVGTITMFTQWPTTPTMRDS
jgi:NAD(P)-dependent dehydrogenase (short-subunit alcohol dehydrogenase family)